MGWEERVREAAITSPDRNTRVVFDYEDVSYQIVKRTTAFNFPDAPGTYVQDSGHTGRKYPLRVFFWGDDYDEQSREFESVILQNGTLFLDHPVYGLVDVIPFGVITRRDDLKTAANQSIFDITFWETTGLVYPSAQSSPGSDVLSSIDGFNDAVAEEFAESIDVSTAVERVSMKNDYVNLLSNAKDKLKSIADAQTDVRKRFNNINNSINQSIDILISDPLTLAFQTTQLIQSPALSLVSINARLSAYGDLLDSITKGDGANVSASSDSRDSNNFQISDLNAMGCVSGAILSVVNNRFLRKSDTLSAAETIISMFDSLVAWRDDVMVVNDIADTGIAYSALQNATAITIGFLVEISFTLKTEKRITLGRPRSIVDLVSELYGVVDDELDFFITSNDLSGSEIIELPRGKTVAYYI